MSRFFYFLLVITASALLFRIWLSVGHLHKADAIFIAKMAQDIVTGQSFPLVYYGQNYMGTIESWITAPLFLFTGPTWWGIGFAPVIVSTAGVIAFYLLGRSLADEKTGLIAAILWAVSPFSMMFYNITPRGAYPEIVCGSALALYFTVEKFKGKRFGTGAGFMIGLTCGLMFWTSVLSVPAIGTLLFFILISDGRGAFNKTNFALGGGLATGGILYLPQALTAKGEKTLGVDFSRMGESLDVLFTTVYESFLPYPAMSPPSWLLFSQKAVFAILAISFLVMTFFSLYRLAKVEEEEPRGGRFLPLALFALLFSAAFLANPTALAAQPRHILPLYIPLIAATAVALGKIPFLRGAIPILVAGAIVISNGYLNVFTFAVLNRNMASEKKIVDKITERLISLDLHSLVYNDYELRNRLTWEAATRGYSLNTMGYNGSRDPKMTLAVERDKNAVFGFHPDFREGFTENYRACCGEGFRVETFPAITMIFPGGEPVRRATESIPPEKWMVKGGLKALGDRKFTTTLATDRSFIVELEKPEAISRIRIVYGGRRPSRMTLSISDDKSQWLTVKAASGASPFVTSGVKTFFRTGFRPEREFEEINFPPVWGRFIKFEVDQVPAIIYDIHELFIYRALRGSVYGAGKPPSPAEVAAHASKTSIKLLAANRWHISSLYGQGYPFNLVLPAFRSFEKSLQISRLSPDGLGALVGTGDEGELSKLLEGENIEYQKRKLGDHVLFTLKGDGPELWWTGFTLIDW